MKHFSTCLRTALLTVLALTLALSSLTSCEGTNDLRQPMTNLELWIGENVDDFDFSGFTERYGLMGGREYYGKGYTPTLNEHGEQVDPEFCVIYTVTAYPDYSSKSHHVTRIAITDPAVELYGLSLASTEDEIESVMTAEGFTLRQYENAYGKTYEKGKFSIHFSPESIVLRVEVTNHLGIDF